LRPDVELVVYPFGIQVGNEILDPTESLAYYLSTQLNGRECVFTFGDSAAAVERLGSSAGLRLDGIAFTLVTHEIGEPSFATGDPDIWRSYQLRNLDAGTLEGLVVDDFEYEVFDRYVNGLRASVAWLDDNGFRPDRSRPALAEMADALERTKNETDYPRGPGH
jgi:hypothetical protein